MKKKGIILTFIVVVLVSGALFIRKQIEEGNVSFGFANADFISLQNGTYVLTDLDLEHGKYGVYALKGAGRVTIDGVSSELNSKLFEDIKNERNDVPMTVHFASLYSESPKVELVADSVIIVDGDENFEISFVRH